MKKNKKDRSGPDDASLAKNEVFRAHTGRYQLYGKEFYDPVKRLEPRPPEDLRTNPPAGLKKRIDEQLKRYEKERKKYATNGDSGSDSGAGGSPRYYLPRHGRTLHRALEQNYVVRSAYHKPGVFGRMFPTLPSVDFTEPSLVSLATLMTDPSGGVDNPAITAGFTFLGQFLDHDITFDPTSSLEKKNDPEAIKNFRTPVFELDSVYGAGPDVHPFLYDADPANVGKMLIGRDTDGAPNDLPRNPQGVALIGDPRNDENLIVSQLHLAFLKFHNFVVDHIEADGVEGGVPVPEPFRFDEAQRVVRWHYQWLVGHEFLQKTLGQAQWERLVEPFITFGPYKKNGRKKGDYPGHLTGQDPYGNTLHAAYYRRQPYIPVEFSVAAYRFGHSQVRPGYQINGAFGGAIFPDLAIGDNLDPAQNVLLAGRAVDWSLFFDTGGSPTPGKRIDPSISGPLANLPGFTTDASLMVRNLKRGNAFSLPWGQRVAAAIGVAPLTDDELTTGGVKLTDLGFPARRAPLWYYVLKEAEVHADGKHLGPVGAHIVATVFVSLLRGDYNSYINHDPTWTPFLKSKKAGDFTIADLVTLAAS